jgi:hypothetical protein
VFGDEVEVIFGVFVEVVVNLTLTRLVNLRGFLLSGDLNVLSNLSSFDGLDIQNKAHEVGEGLGSLLHDILVSNDVGGDVLVQPPRVEFFPDGDLLVNELSPGCGESLEIFIGH